MPHMFDNSEVPVVVFLIDDIKIKKNIVIISYDPFFVELRAEL